MTQKTILLSRKLLFVAIITYIYLPSFQAIIKYKIFNLDLKFSEYWAFIIQFFWYFSILSSNLYTFLVALIILEAKRRITFVITIISSKKFDIKKVSTILLKIDEIFKLINRFFAFPILISITQLTVGTTFEFFEIFSVLISPNASKTQIAFSLISLQFWTYLNILMIFLLICCGKANSEASNVEKSLYESLPRENDRERKKKIKILILLIKNVRPRLSCGIFELNWTVILSVSKMLKKKR